MNIRNMENFCVKWFGVLLQKQENLAKEPVFRNDPFFLPKAVVLFLKEV